MTRLWNWLNNQQDFFYPISQWPLHLQKMMLRSKKTSLQRYTLFSFLNGNGVDPQIAVQAIYVQDVRQGVLIPGNYDAEALREFQRFINRSRKNELNFYGPMHYWDMHDKERK